MHVKPDTWAAIENAINDDGRAGKKPEEESPHTKVVSYHGGRCRGMTRYLCCEATLFISTDFLK
jgi:hypothetical protein